MLFKLQKIVNRCAFPVKYRQSTCYRLLPAAATLLSLLSVNCHMLEKTPDKSVSQPSPAAQVADAGEIHRRAIAIDLHADTTQRMLDEQVDLTQRLSDGHLDSVRAKEGGLDAQFFSIWVEPQLYGAGGLGAMKRADAQIAAV